MTDAVKPKKTLDQIVNDTLSSNFGISDADLQLLFNDPAATTAPDQTSANATLTVEPVTAPPPAAEPTAPAASPTVTLPAVSMPEPPPTVPTVEPVSTMDKSKDIEDSLKSMRDELRQLATIVQEQSTRRSQAPGTEPANATPDPLDEIDDQAIIQSPKENVVKATYAILKKVLPAAFAEYDTARATREFLDRFRSEHPDFDELRPLMRQVVAENPAVNDNFPALPRVYEEAKKRRLTALEAMRKELNIPSGPVSTTTAPPLSEEEIVAKVAKQLKEEITKRRQAAVPLTPSQTTPISPSDRQTPNVTTKPMTEEEKMFQEMLDSGPPSTKFLHGLDLISKK